jgi:anti-anti-sigma factor
VADAGFTRVRVESYGLVCVLAVSGELDIVTAAGFAADASGMVDAQAERLVLDLSALRFIDCSGARALAAVTHVVRGDCPVVVRSVHPAVRRVLQLMGLNLERRLSAAGAVPGGRPDENQPQAEADALARTATGRVMRQSETAGPARNS